MFDVLGIATISKGDPFRLCHQYAFVASGNDEIGSFVTCLVAFCCSSSVLRLPELVTVVYGQTITSLANSRRIPGFSSF
jgi:hypothetical protein